MKKTSRLTKILSYQSFGFLAIIVLCWLNSLLGLPSLIFANQKTVNDLESPTLQMLLILGVWLLVNASTRRKLERLKHLESFMRICAWCHHIDYKGEWVSLENFLEQGFDTPTTHGICQECLEKQRQMIERAKRDRNNRAKKTPTPGNPPNSATLLH